MHVNQKGFTLIELMIALTLGLLISAAALMMFLSSQRSLAIQGGMGEIQQNSIFGLNRLTYQLRHIALNTGSATISPTESGSGIIFNNTQSPAATSFTTAGADPTPMNENADRLTIRYTMPTDTMRDCEGTDNLANQTIIEQYRIAELPANQQSGADKRYGLYCDSSAGGLGANEVVLIPDAENLKISFITRNTNGTSGNRTDDTLRYQTLANYLTGPTGSTVVGMEVGIVMRSSNSVHGDQNINTNSFDIAGQTVTLKTPNNNYLRTPITQVVAIRNSQGH